MRLIQSRLRQVPMVCLGVGLAAADVAAQQRPDAYHGELLLIGMPREWREVPRTRLKNGVIEMLPPQLSEYLPPGQTLDNWSEMISREIWLKVIGSDPEWYILEHKTNPGKAVCPNQQTNTIARGEEDGYPFAVVLEHCPLYTATGKGEVTMYKAIKGRDSFYVVWRSLRVPPFRAGKSPMSQQTVLQWTYFMRDAVRVCDTRIAGSCPQSR